MRTVCDDCTRNDECCVVLLSSPCVLIVLVLLFIGDVLRLAIFISISSGKIKTNVFKFW